MKKTILVLTLVLLLFDTLAQEYQTYANAGFKIKKEYKLQTNTVLLNTAKQNNINNIIAAYIEAENEESSTKGVIYNINVYDESSSYGDKASQKYLDGIRQGLKLYGYQYTIITYQGVPAIEYTYSMHSVPTKVLAFLKNKRAYMIQVATRDNLPKAFEKFKNGIIIQ